jgi:hypothetical protein
MPTSVQMQQTFYKTGLNFGGSSLNMMNQYASESESEESDGEASYL